METGEYFLAEGGGAKRSKVGKGETDAERSKREKREKKANRVKLEQEAEAAADEGNDGADEGVAGGRYTSATEAGLDARTAREIAERLRAGPKAAAVEAVADAAPKLAGLPQKGEWQQQPRGDHKSHKKKKKSGKSNTSSKKRK